MATRMGCFEKFDEDTNRQVGWMRNGRLLADMRLLDIAVVILIGLVLTACGSTAVSDQEEAAEQVSEGVVQFGELEKVEGFTIGPTVRESVTVWNCDNPNLRNDKLKEVKSIDREVKWFIVGEVGAEVEASILAASAVVEGSIANGYELNVSDELSRSRELDMPVSPNSSVEYIIEWKPVLWNGFVPFTYQTGESRIEYQYQRLEFGEIVDFNDRTIMDCSRQVTPIFTPTAETIMPAEPPPEESPTSETPPLIPEFQTISLQPWSELKSPEINLGVSPGLNHFLEIPFETGWSTSTQCTVAPGRWQSFVVGTDISNPQKIYLLIQAGYGFTKYKDKQVGSVKLNFADGTTLDTPLVLGVNIRDWAWENPAAVNTASSDSLRAAIRGAAPDGTPGGMDILTIGIPGSQSSSTLTSIEIADVTTDTTGEMDPCIHLVALTVEYLR